MTNEEHLLVCLMEECGEVIQAVSKALRFGLDNTAPNSSLTNAEEIAKEFADVVVVVNELNRRGTLKTAEFAQGAYFDAKIEKIRHFVQYSKDIGTITDDTYITGFGDGKVKTKDDE